MSLTASAHGEIRSLHKTVVVRDVKCRLLASAACIVARGRTAATGAVHQGIESEQCAVHYVFADRHFLWKDAHNTGFCILLHQFHPGHHKQVSRISDLSIRC